LSTLPEEDPPVNEDDGPAGHDADQGPSTTDKAKDLANDLLEKARPFVDKAGEVAGDLAEKAKPAMDKAGEVAGDLAEKAKPALDKAGETAGDLLGKAKGFFNKDDRSDDAGGPAAG